ncbi:MAG: AAA family ATPase [Spongiibacteraceae bacterium]
MYNQYFGFAEAPFSIAPDPRYLFLSEQHREALAHLLYGIGDQGGFIVLTGEVGTGKTTVCRCLLQQLPDHADVAFIVNPKLDSRELLQTICEELGAPLPEGELSIKQMIDALNELLLSTHARGRNAILIIDEAQNLDVDVLEQLRLLTNLETSERKLLQLILLGQPELNTLLARPELRQLAQRVTARYHLRPLSREEAALYIEHRLAIAGCRGHLFQPAAVQQIFRHSQGIPRLINLLCDRALLGVYAGSGNVVDAAMVRRAAREVLPAPAAPWFSVRNVTQVAAIASGVLVLAAALALYLHRPPANTTPPPLTEVAAQAGWLHILSTGDHAEASALAAIGRRWGMAPEKAATLSCGDTADWGCVRLQQQTRGDLQRYNAPGILFLRDEAANDQLLALALLQFDGDNALVHFAGRDWTLPWAEIAQRWNGSLNLPLPAPVSQLPIEAGARGALVGWLDDQLYRRYHQNRPRWIADPVDDSARLGDAAPKAAWLASFYLGLHAAPRRETLDPTLVAELKRFQKEVSLSGDGALNLATVLALTYTGSADAPRLTDAQQVVAPQARSKSGTAPARTDVAAGG